MSDDVTLERRLVGGQPVVWVAGELDAFAVEPIRRLVGEVVTPSARGIVLDLSEVTYLDSAAVHLIGQLAANLRAHRQELRVVIPRSSPLRLVVAIAGLDTVVPIDGDDASAAAAVARGSP